MASESPEQTVERIEAIPPDKRTKSERSALNSAKWAIEKAALWKAREEEEKRVLASTLAPPASADGRSRAREDSTPGRSSDDLPTVTARIRDNIAREVDSLLANSVGLDTSDRVKVLTAAARVTGFADSDDAGQPAPFVSRGFVQPPVSIPTGAEPWVCGTCGALHSPGGPVPADARVTLEPESLRTTTDPIA